MQWLISTGAGIGFVADGFITAVLVNLLRSKHIGVKRYACYSLCPPALADSLPSRMDVLLNTLILYTINTGKRSRAPQDCFRFQLTIARLINRVRRLAVRILN